MNSRDSRQRLAQLQASIHQPPLTLRAALLCGSQPIGSVEADAFAQFASQAGMADVVRLERHPESGQLFWQLQGDPSRALNTLAAAMRQTGYAQVAHLWRNEQLAVRDTHGQQVASVERGAVRALGIATHGVHLHGVTAHQHTWIQQRAQDKKTDPGRWDTLMGGMVSAQDTLEQALARETQEEAGLQLAQLSGLSRVGHFTMRMPNAADNGLEYVVERIDWFECLVPDGICPVNTDGEVQQFKQVAADTLAQMLLEGAFTIEAALILLQSAQAAKP